MPDNSSPKVTIPTQGADKPRLAQVGAVAVVCFLIGVIWPTLAGVRLVPEPPTKKKAGETEEVKPKPKRTPEAEPTDEVPAMKIAAEPKDLLPGVAVDDSLVVNCRDDADRKLNDCDKPGFDAVAKDRLMALLACEAAGTPDGTLSIGFDLDFKKKKIRRVVQGKSTTLDDATAGALVECAKQEFMNATLDGVQHTHPYYLVFYPVTFSPPGATEEAAAATDPVVEASGQATVIWNSARLRTGPEDGEVKDTLMYGAKVFVTGRQGDWYRVKYNAKGSEAWVHKNALAL